MNLPFALLPLSAAQQELWLGQESSASKSGSVIAELFRMEGSLDVNLFRRSVAQAFSEVESLRIRLVAEDGVLRQYVDSSLQLHCPFFDLTHEPSPEEALQRYVRADYERSAAMTEAPYCTMPLFRLAASEYAWCSQAPHLLLDGYSGNLWAERVVQIYNALLRDEEVPGHTFGRMVDLLAEEGKYRRSAHFERDREFWAAAMQDRGEPVSLAARDDQQRRGWHAEVVPFSAQFQEAFAAGANTLGVSASSALFAAAAIYVFKMSGQPKFTLGLPVTARHGDLMRRMPSAVSNILPLTIEVTPDDSVVTLARNITSQVRRVLRHQRYRSEDMRRDLGQKTDRVALFHAHINFLRFDYGLKFEDTTTTVQNLSTGTVDDFNFEFYDRQDGTGISVQLKLQETLYSPEEAALHARRFGHLLGVIGVDFNQSIASLPLLCGIESSLLLGVWSGTEAALPAGCAHEWFEEHARRTPEATALEFGQEQLSYGELNRRANQLAHHLRALGVQPDDRVAVCLERGFAMLVSLLAVLKAGGAYVPLDPAYPPDRLRFALQDAAPRLWISQQAIATALFADEQDASSAPRLLRFEDRSSPWEQPAWDHNLDPEAVGLQPHHLAYLIYTSGSTGQPKGVMVEHRQLSARLAGVRQNLACTAGDHMPVVSSPGFDISLLETLLPLISGGVARLTDAQRIKQMPYLLAETRTATLFNAVTSLMEAWSHSLPPQQQIRQHYPALRTLLVGGEPVSQRLLNQLIAQFPEAHIVQTYGPTEATLYCTSGIATPSQDTTVRPPIGRPLPNTRIYILDAHRQLVPVGVSGEIFIGGASVARGYLNQPDLTAERFLHDPFSPHPQARMYRSGDLGRWLPDGSIEFIGRNDSQVKIRGFRIELGEIEAQLARHPQVQDADVIAREDRPGEKRLVAYLVPKDHANPPAVDSLHTLLAAALPEHMVPAAYVILPARPLSPNGKLDRNALPAPDRNAFDTEEFQPPQGEIEQKIAEIWKDLLGIQRIGRKDNFFQIGGHSLLAISLIERLRQQNLQIDIRTLFATPTLQRLAQSASLRKILPIPKNRIPNENTLAEDEVEITI